MKLVRLRTKKINDFWIMDNIRLTPFEDTSPPFDLDKVYPEGREYIERSVRVTGRVELLDASRTREAPIEIVPSKEPFYELPGQISSLPRNIILAVDADDTSEEDPIIVQSEAVVEQDFVPPIVKETQVMTAEKDGTLTPSKSSMFDISAEDRKKANKLLASKIAIVETAVERLPHSKEARKFIFVCLETEKSKKARKKVLALLEKKFLAIPPDGE